MATDEQSPTHRSRHRSRHQGRHGRPWSARAAVGLLFSLLFAAPGPGQDDGSPGAVVPPVSPYFEETQVRIVLVPVTVIDADGEPVPDLVEADFELFVDGRPRAIESFDPPLIDHDGQPHPGPEPEAASGLEDSPPGTDSVASPAPIIDRRRWSYVALALDRYMSRPRGVARGFSALREQLAAPMPPRTRMGLFAIIDGRMETVVPFTDEMDAIRDGIDVLWKDHSQVDYWVRDDEQESSPPLWPLFRGDAISRSMACNRAGMLAQRQAMRIRRLLTGLQALARAMGELPGRKNVVLLSEGVRLRAGMNYLGGELGSIHCVENMALDFRRATDTFKAANVALSPVSLLGLYPGERADPLARDEQLGTAQLLAEETGGRRPQQTNDFDGELTRAVVQPLRAYLLGLRPADDAPGSRHTIEVRVRRPGLQVHARREYVVPEEDYPDKARFSLAAILPGAQDDLAMDGRLWVVPTDGRNVRLELQVTVPTRSLLAVPAGGRRLKVDVQMNGILLDDAGRAEEIITSAYTVRFDEPNAPPRLVLQETADLPLRRAADLLVVVQDRLSGDTTARTYPAAPPPRRVRKAALTPPRVYTPAGDDHVLSPSGMPLMALSTGRGLYLPAGARPAGIPQAVVVRVRAPGRDGKVRFCGSGDRLDACVEGRRAPAPHPGEEPLVWALAPGSGRFATDLDVRWNEEPALAADHGVNALAAAASSQ